MMNDNMKLVLKALRSGEYKQTKGTLEDNNGHCCLGVMCDVYQKDTGISVDCRPNGSINGGSLSQHTAVQEWVGLRNDHGGFTGKHKDTVSLAGLNDSGSTFSQIADFIESEPEGLLV
jgi:hypothetical protein